MSASDKQLYYRLIALWAVCEGTLGGIIHGFNLPITGLIVGSGAVIIICLIGYYVPSKGAIIKATVIVAIFKMMLSPQSPLPAYFAVFFQGITGELFFSVFVSPGSEVRRGYKIACIVFAALALLESGIQRIIVMTLLYGTSFWKAVNDFINNLTHQKTVTNYSLLLAGGYVLLHLVVGIFIGWMAAGIPTKVKLWRNEFQLESEAEPEQTMAIQKPGRKKRFWKRSLFLVWMILIILFLQSEFKIGSPLLSSNTVLHILIRSLIIVLTWYFLISPLLTFLLKKWLAKQQAKSKSTINEILILIPSTQTLVEKSWLHSADEKGLRRLQKFLKIILVNSLVANRETLEDL